jgi:uncharacterized protein YndB with AHSA1/START domain
MKEYTSTSMIRASQGAVWALLTDGAGYREWNPEIVQLDGRIARGERITAHVRLGDGAVRRVPLRVSALEAPNRMEWTGGLPLGLFIGRRLFTLTACAGGVEFRLHLAMSGLLGPLILKSVGDRQPELDSFSSALKLRCENIRP